MTPSHDRIVFLDTSRAMAMFLVVFAHLYASDSKECLYIYAFHMPFFFFVSGMLHKEMSIVGGAGKHAKVLLIPSLTYLFIGGICQKLFYGWHFMQFFFASLDSAWGGWGFYRCGPVWFLIALFWVKIVADVYLRNFFWGLAVWIGLFSYSLVYGNHLFLCSAMMAFPLYIIGYRSKAGILSMSRVAWTKWLFPVFFALSYVLTAVNGRVSMVGHHFGSATVPYNIIMFYANGILGTLGLLCMSFFLKKLQRPITIVATSLITVVGLHELFIAPYNILIGSKSYLFTVPGALAIIALCCLCHWIISSYFPFMLGKDIRPALKRLLDWGYEVVCPFLPLQKKIVFDNFYGRGMGDDPKYIALYIRDHYPDVKLIWLLSDMNTPMPDGITPVFIYSRKARYHLYTAKVWVDNIKTFPKTPKRKGQFYLQTWHGGIIGPKLAEAQIEDKLPTDYVKAAKKDASITDLMYSDNDFVKAIFEKDFWYHGDVLKCDIPRVSVVKNPPVSLRGEVLKYFNIPEGKKILLYAPTHRGVKDASLFVWDYERVLRALSTRFGGDFVMLLRLHPNFADISGSAPYFDKIISASHYPDMQELLAVSDVLISDYSSCFFEFSVTFKPVFLYGPDVDDYCSNRGLLFQFDELPFEMTKTIDELENSIVEFDELDYRKKIGEFSKRIGLQETGHGAEQVSKMLIQHIY